MIENVTKLFDEYKTLLHVIFVQRAAIGFLKFIKNSQIKT